MVVERAEKKGKMEVMFLKGAQREEKRTEHNGKDGSVVRAEKKKTSRSKNAKESEEEIEKRVL